MLKLHREAKLNAIRSVTIRAPARLHLGFLDQNGALGRHFGSIGLAIDRPETVLRAAIRSAAAPAERDERLAEVVRRMADALDVSDAIDVVVEREIPAHQGFGSGTQLAMSVGAALSALAGRQIDLVRLAEIA
ncbi:MAG: beta-ribofuranosylaminobenzene 5'-phosphate synthase, partial [Microvirga sp.]